MLLIIVKLTCYSDRSNNKKKNKQINVDIVNCGITPIGIQSNWNKHPVHIILRSIDETIGSKHYRLLFFLYIKLGDHQLFQEPTHVICITSEMAFDFTPATSRLTAQVQFERGTSNCIAYISLDSNVKFVVIILKKEVWHWKKNTWFVVNYIAWERRRKSVS